MDNTIGYVIRTPKGYIRRILPGGKTKVILCTGTLIEAQLWTSEEEVKAVGAEVMRKRDQIKAVYRDNGVLKTGGTVLIDRKGA